MKFRYALAFLLAMAFGTQAEANWGLGYGGCGFAGYGYGAYALGHIPTPPYFALHPPVYYGHRIHRTYGRSPFARGPVNGYAPAPRPRLVVNRYLKGGALQASVDTKQPQPALVINPYVQQDGAQLATKESGPQMIINPYYQPETNTQVARK